MLTTSSLHIESFLPFDREATFSSAVVLIIAAAVDPSLLRDKESRLNIAYSILDDMAGRGNRIAEYHKHELEQLDLNMQKLISFPPHATISMGERDARGRSHSDAPPTVDTVGSEWNSEDGFSGEQLMAVANSLDFNQLDWLVSGDIERPFGDEF